MTTFREQAQAYEPPQTKNIADLKVVPIDVPMTERTFKQGTPDEFTAKIITIDGEDYRVPGSVLYDIKAIIEEDPKVEFVKVKKSGLGQQTRYTVIPLPSNALGD